MERKVLSAIIWKEGKWFVAKALGLELASQGQTKKEALKNLQEALDLLLEEEGMQILPSVILRDPELGQIYA